MNIFNFMLKLIFDKDVNLFRKKLIRRSRGGDFKKGASHSDFMFGNTGEICPILHYQKIATLTPI